MHLFLADSPSRAGRTPQILGFLLKWVIAEHGATRLVAEPDATNDASLARAASFGFAPGPVATLPDKTAQFMFLDLA